MSLGRRKRQKGVFKTLHLVSVLPSTFSLGFSKESKDAWPIES